MDQGKIQEALCFNDNQGLAIVGNNVLDLYNSLTLYNKGYYSEQIDKSRQILFSREKHREIINSDPEFVNYIIKNDYEANNQKRIGKERADRYFEAVIGAIYFQEGMEAVGSFVENVYQVSD